MGYRSDVKFVYQTKTKGEVDQLLNDLHERLDKAYKKESGYYKGNMFDHIKVVKTDERDYIMVSYDDVKWYASEFTDIDVFEGWKSDLYDMVYEDEENKGYHYIRLGESPDDIEEEFLGDLDCQIDLIRRIEFSKIPKNKEINYDKMADKVLEKLEDKENISKNELSKVLKSYDADIKDLQKNIRIDESGCIKTKDEVDYYEDEVGTGGFWDLAENISDHFTDKTNDVFGIVESVYNVIKYDMNPSQSKNNVISKDEGR